MSNERLAPLLIERSARLHELDYPGQWTQRVRDAYTLHTEDLDRQIANIHAETDARIRAESRINAIDRQIESLTTFRDRYPDKWRQRLSDELDTALAALERNVTRQEEEQIQNLRLSLDSVTNGLHSLAGYFDGGAAAFTLKSLRLARLMEVDGFVPDLTDTKLARFSGYPWRGSIREIDEQLATLEKEKRAAQHALALIGETV